MVGDTILALAFNYQTSAINFKDLFVLSYLIRNPCEVIALVHLGYYHLSFITYNSVFISIIAYPFQNSKDWVLQS